jgi:regulator of RNase E activity RraA
MNRKISLIVAAAAAFLASTPAHAQLWTWTKEQIIEYTKGWTGERFSDGRPKVPDSFLERAKGMSQEEVLINWGTGGGRGGPGGAAGGGRGGAGGGGGMGYSQFAGDFQVLHPGKKMVGRALTVQFMPTRPDLDQIVLAKAREKGIQGLNNQYAIDMVQPGDILVVDLMNKKEGGTIVGDNLFYYIMKASHGAGLVLDGSFRDLEGISEFDMPCYYRAVHPTAISYALGGVSLAGINVPIRIGNVTVMPGDLVLGDREGVSFIPPQFAETILDNADTVHVHDEWTRKKFDEGKYKSSEIYGSPKDPALQKEYQEYLKKRLEEIRKSR